MAKNSNGGKLALGALIGIVAGFVTGILTAPKSGRETRKDIKDTASKVFRDAEKKLKALQSELSDLIDQGTKIAKDQGNKAKKGLNQAIETATEAKQKVKIIISAMKSGETDEPELKAAIKEATAAKDHLKKYLSSK